MCILLKLDYEKFGVSSLLFSRVTEEKLLGVGSTPPLVMEGLTRNSIPSHVITSMNWQKLRNLVHTRAVYRSGWEV